MNEHKNLLTFFGGMEQGVLGKLGQTQFLQ